MKDTTIRSAPAPRIRFGALLAGAISLSLLAACGDKDGEAPAAPTAGDPAVSATDGSINPEHWPQVEWPLQRDPAMEQKIDALLASMTIEEKVGQLVQGDIASITPDDVRKYRLGSILAGGNSDPGGRYDAAPAEWLALADAFYEASMDTSGGGKAIPIIFGIDAVHGQSNIVGATLFPHNIGLGAARNPDLIREIGRITAIETRTTGMEWTFAPTVAVPQDDRWGRTYEGYSEHPEIVASYAGAMVEGLQGKPGSPEFLDAHHVASSVKHFLGDGGTTNGKDQGDTQVSEAVLRDVHNAGYPPSVAAGAQIVMASFNSFHGVKMHGHKPLLTDVLKGRMNFDGFVVGDWNGHGQIPGCSTENCPATINAGLDMAMAPDSWKGFYETAVAAAKSGEITAERLDDAVRRILRVKFRLGLFEAGKPSARALGGKFELLGAPEHRAVARQAVRESLVLLKNQDKVLPLSPKGHILVAGSHADDMGLISGGWTLNWQGTGTKRADYPNADTVWEGMSRAVKDAGGSAELAIDGRYTRKPDAAVVVFGEKPYAEFQGDIATLLYKPGDESDLELLKRLKAEGIPVIAVFISGRPLWVNREINAADAFVAAWLPGSEGAGIADVLLAKADGSVNHDFKGKLSYSWPRTAGQFVNNVGMEGYDPLFAYGFGLTYADDGNLAALPEEPGIDNVQAATGVYFQRGEASPGTRLMIGAGDGGATTPVATVPAALAGDALTVRGVDHKAQEDARRFAWAGKGRASVALVADQPQDLSRESNGDVLIALTLRRESEVPKDLVARVGCGEGCEASVPVADLLARVPADTWTTVGVPLRCFAGAGADMTRLQTLLRLETAGALQLSISRAELATIDVVEHRLSCAPPTGG